MVIICIIEATYEDHNWKFTTKERRVRELKPWDVFSETKTGYSYAYNPSEEGEWLAMELFKSYIATAQRKRIGEIYRSIEDLME